MFCKNCGKQVPNDSTYCPYCRTTLKAWVPNIQKEETNKDLIVNSTNEDKKKDQNIIRAGKIVLTKEETIKYKIFNNLSIATMILTFVGIPILVLLLCGVTFAFNGDSKTADEVIKAGKIILITSLVFLIGIIGLNIAHLVLVFKHKKQIESYFKVIVVFRILFLILVIGLTAVTIYNLSLNQKVLPTSLFIANLVPGMFSVMFSIVNAINIKPLLLSPKTIAAVEYELSHNKK